MDPKNRLENTLRWICFDLQTNVRAFLFDGHHTEGVYVTRMQAEIGDELFTTLVVYYPESDEIVVIDAWHSDQVGQLSWFKISRDGKFVVYRVDTDTTEFLKPQKGSCIFQFNLERRTLRVKKLREDNSWRHVRCKVKTFAQWVQQEVSR